MPSLNMSVKPFYTSAQLAKYIGYKSTHGTRSFMKRLGVPVHLVGFKYIYYLSDMQIYSPELFASILESRQINKQILDREEDEQDLVEEDETSTDPTAFKQQLL